MKKSILFIVLIISVTANAQSLKDLLYSGKLKNDSGSVIRKGDDLSTKIDTSKKKPFDTEKTITKVVGKDSSGAPIVITQVDSSATPATPAFDNNVVIKDNNKIWKDYIDSLTSLLKEEVLPSKKIKSDTYYVLINYEIGVDGEVGVSNVSVSPENSFIQDQVKERLTLTAPKLNPVVVNGKARKSVKKSTFTLSKL